MLKFILLVLPWFAFAAESHFVAGCRILKRDGTMLMTFPGRSCSFLKDGRVLSFSPTHIRMFENTGKVDWEMKLPTEKTTYALSDDQKKILLSSLRPGDLPGDPFNFILNVLDLNGYRMRTMETFTLFGLEKPARVTDFRATKSGYFISLYGDGVYFLDEFLKLTKKKIVLGPKNEVEQVHLTAEENFYYFVRPERNDFIPDPVVYAEEFDAAKNRVVFRWPSRRTPGFYFPRGGSVVLSGDVYVINHPVSGSYLVSRKSGELIDYVTKTHLDINQIRIPEEVTLSDLSAFFERWKF